jgi:hypothetical protein
MYMFVSIDMHVSVCVCVCVVWMRYIGMMMVLQVLPHKSDDPLYFFLFQLLLGIYLPP